MASWAVIECNEQILLIRRSKITSRPGQWCFPGGGIKNHETAEAACSREVKEETGLDVEITETAAVMGENHYFRCHMQCDTQQINLQLKECDAFIWVEPARLLAVGQIMDFRTVYQVMLLMGFDISLNDEARQTTDTT